MYTRSHARGRKHPQRGGLLILRALIAAVAVMALAPASVAETPAVLRAFYVNESYDWRASPYRDLERAIEQASAQNKRILVVVGGDWCGWCEILDRFLVRDADARTAFERSFVVLKVNMSSQNQNAAFLSGFPDSRGYPDFFILESNGAYLGRQRTDVLEAERDYDRARMVAFAERWAR
jgi:thioredoxin-related protein